MELDWTAVIATFGSMIAPISGIAGVVVGHMLNRGHSQKEKVKDLRRSAYGVILSELSAAQPFYAAVANGIAEDVHSYHSSDRWPRHANRIGEHMSSARQCFEREYLVLSDVFIARYEKMLHDIAAAEDETHPFGNVEEDGEIARSALIDLMKIARAEVAD